MEAEIFVRFTVPGFHSWPDAPPLRAYLGYQHRHLFHVEIKVDVENDEREIEFHDLLDFAKQSFPEGDKGTKSCEAMARDLGGEIARHFRRQVRVSVSEDGEAGASVTVEPDETKS